MGSADRPAVPALRHLGKGGTTGKPQIEEYGYDHGAKQEWRDDGQAWDAGGKITGVAAVSWNNGSNIRVYFSYFS
jgi:hypothetical protein